MGCWESPSHNEAQSQPPSDTGNPTTFLDIIGPDVGGLETMLDTYLWSDRVF